LKFNRFFIFLILLICSFQTASQNMKEYNHELEAPLKTPYIFKTSPGHMLSGPVPLLTAEYGVLFETPISKRTSLEVGISAIGKGLGLFILEKNLSQPYHSVSFLVKGIELQIAYKWYLSKTKHQAPKGFYLSPLIKFSQGGIGQAYDYRIKDNYVSFTNYSINMIYGFQKIRTSGRGFVIDSFFGLGYKKNIAERHYSAGYSVPYNLNQTGYYASPVSIVVGLYFGWGFCRKD
jgi:hypothetical protein